MIVNYTASCGHVSSVDAPDHHLSQANAALVEAARLEPCASTCDQTPYTQIYHVVWYTDRSLRHVRGHLCLWHIRNRSEEEPATLTYTSPVNDDDQCTQQCVRCHPTARQHYCGHWS